MKFDWVKAKGEWIGIYGLYRASIYRSSLLWCWSLKRGQNSQGSGGTSSVAASKRAAEAELERLTQRC